MIQLIKGPKAVALAQQWLDLPSAALEALRVAADASDPAVSVWAGGDLIALGGFIPTSLISGTAFVWMEHTPSTTHHKIATMRIGREVLAAARTRYPRIIGTCSLGPRSEAWLASLGARFGEGSTKPFVIGG